MRDFRQSEATAKCTQPTASPPRSATRMSRGLNGFNGCEHFR
jgi:hypothetical protein